jgi:hypothetical protein
MANFRYFLMCSSVTGSLLAACGHNEPPAQAVPTSKAPTPRVPPTVVEAARHYAALLARSAQLSTPTQRQYGGQQPTLQDLAADSPGYHSLSWRLPRYEIHAFANQQWQLKSLTIKAPHVPDDPNRAVFEPRKPLPRLVRLRELRQAFGRETMVPPAALGQCTFSYRPVATEPALLLLAFLSTDAPTDTTMVQELAISPMPAH